MKTKIIFKRNYTGENKPQIKKGDPMRIICPKEELIAEFMDYNMRLNYNNLEAISLLSYVRKRVEKICEVGSVYYKIF